MIQSGFTGISYPFRISNRGGVVLSTTGQNNARHIQESIQQILNTRFLERPMESEIYSSVSALLFEPDDETLQSVLRARIVEDLERLEPRIEIEDDGIRFVVEDGADGEILYVMLTYLVIKYQTFYTSKIKVGGLNNE